MGWKGIAIGSLFGSYRGGILGGILGAVVGNFIEKLITGQTGPTGSSSRPYGRRPHAYSGLSDARRMQIFCASSAAMLAKLAKADGHVSREEIAVAEQAFARLGFDAGTRAYAVRVFRRAKDDSHTIYEYAAEFAAAVDSIELRELLYEILWDLACADGVVGAGEMEILRRLPSVLGIRPQWFNVFVSERLRSSRYGGSSSGSREPADSLAAAYATLGISASATDDEAKRAYRELAKKNHPDALRAQGLPEAMVAKANEKMGRINAAWKTIKESRGL